MKTLKVTVHIPIKEELLKEKGYTAEELASSLCSFSDEVADGIVITRDGTLGDSAGTFYMDCYNAYIQKVEVVKVTEIE